MASRSLTRVLEIATGTGVVTRRLAAALPEQVSIVATDLNQAMLNQAVALEFDRRVEWRQADAMHLPFEGTFDAVVCQFGVMFFPDQAKAFSEARRVLRAGGVFIFNVWDRIEENEFADTVTKALEVISSPTDPPRFLARTPPWLLRSGDHRARSRSTAGSLASVPGGDGCRRAAVRTLPRSRRSHIAGYTVAGRSRRATPSGSSTRPRIVADAIARRFGRGAVDGKIRRTL